MFGMTPKSSVTTRKRLSGPERASAAAKASVSGFQSESAANGTLRVAQPRASHRSSKKAASLGWQACCRCATHGLPFSSVFGGAFGCRNRVTVRIKIMNSVAEPVAAVVRDPIVVGCGGLVGRSRM